MPIVFQTDGGNADGAGALAVFAGLGICAMGIVFVIAALVIAGMWKMFAKAGRPGWAAIIPFYGDMIRNEIAGVPVVWTYYTWIVLAVNMLFGGLGGLGAIILLAINYFTYGPFLKAYGRNNDTVSVVIALLFPFVVFPQIGFNAAATYVGPDAAAVAALPALPWIDNANTSAPAAPPSNTTPPSINTAPPSMKGTADDDLNKPQQ
jgi:hypothetical protein